MADEDESAVFTQRDKDLQELYPTPEAWERSYPPIKRPEDPELRQQYDDFLQMYPPEARIEQTLRQSETSAEIAAKRQRDLDAHDRRVMRGAADASRDALHDNGPGKQPGLYTTQAAREQAAHSVPPHRIEPEK